MSPLSPPSTSPGYEISPYKQSPGSGEDEDETDEEEALRKKASIPSWARDERLKKAVRRQMRGGRGDPHQIFPMVKIPPIKEQMPRMFPELQSEREIKRRKQHARLPSMAPGWYSPNNNAVPSHQ
jgi:hypothetical protein